MGPESLLLNKSLSKAWFRLWKRISLLKRTFRLAKTVPLRKVNVHKETWPLVKPEAYKKAHRDVNKKRPFCANLNQSQSSPSKALCPMHRFQGRWARWIERWICTKAKIIIICRNISISFDFYQIIFVFSFSLLLCSWKL